MSQQALEDICTGINVNGDIFNKVEYADKRVIFADTPEVLRLVENVMDSGDQHGQKTNASKTKVMVISTNQKLRANMGIYGTNIQVVRRFKYLGYCITQNLDVEPKSEQELKTLELRFSRMHKITNK